MSKCIKTIILLLICAIFVSPAALGKNFAKKGKNKPAVTTKTEPVEIDEEFKGEFKYFNPEEEKLKLKEEKKAAKLEKKRKKLEKRKIKLEKKSIESQNKIELYKKYTEDLKHSFLPSNSLNTDE